MQSKLDELCRWSEHWQLSISYKKSNIMSINSCNNVSNATRSLRIGDNAVTIANHVKDFGVTVDNRLRFDTHINQIVARAFVGYNRLYKCFTSRDTVTPVRAFIVHVRPILEYASCIWSPYHIMANKKLESVQCKFTQRLPGFKGLNYSE